MVSRLALGWRAGPGSQVPRFSSWSRSPICVPLGPSSSSVTAEAAATHDLWGNEHTPLSSLNATLYSCATSRKAFTWG